MWLLNVDTLGLEDFQGTQVPEYAILSHTWGEEEISFQDVRSQTGERKVGWEKFIGCCARAKEDGFRYCWIDTCCIDKSSSAELSEAINSMFQWYKQALVCYAYLSDVPTWDAKAAELSEKSKLSQALNRSRWFTRGWTLQELIAPSSLIFYAEDWTEIGTKLSLRHRIETITGIPIPLLKMERPLKGYNLATRMSWAAKRETTRTEDMAYCLLGIFNVHMPMLYGEGSRAFLRLQQEILLTTDDSTLFGWSAKQTADGGNERDDTPCGFLAPSPSYFRDLPVPPGLAKATFSNLLDVNNVHRMLLLSGQSESKVPHLAHRLSPEFDPPQFSSRGIKVTLPATADMMQLSSGTVAIHCFIHTGRHGNWCLAVHVVRVPGYAGFMRASPSATALSWIRGEDFDMYPTQKLFLHASLTEPTREGRPCLLQFQIDDSSRADLDIDLRDVKTIGDRVGKELALDDDSCVLDLDANQRCLIQVRCQKLGIMLRAAVLNNGVSCVCLLTQILSSLPAANIWNARIGPSTDFNNCCDRAVLHAAFPKDASHAKRICITASIRQVPRTLVQDDLWPHYQCQLTISSSGFAE